MDYELANDSNLVGQGILTALRRLIKATPKNRRVSSGLLEETVSEISLSTTPSVADVNCKILICENGAGTSLTGVSRRGHR